MTEQHQKAPAESKSTSSKRPQHRRGTRTLTTNIDAEADRWPYCLVWTPLPIITWFLPFIGHTGIADSTGVIYDFSGDFSVSVDNFSFGNPTKYYQFNPSQIVNGASGWDKAIHDTSEYYCRTRHSLFFNNCHQFIAGVLNKAQIENRTDWTQKEVWCKITFKSRYTGFMGFIRQWWPFTVILIAIIILFAVIF